MLALQYHPDRVTDEKKSEAKEKFNSIHQAYSVLSDGEKKKAYDDGLDIFFTRATVSAQWESHLKVLELDDFVRARKKYQNSEEEKMDIICETKRGNGSLTHLLHNVPFMRGEDEGRIIKLINQLILDGKLPKMKLKRIAKKWMSCFSDPTNEKFIQYLSVS